MKYSIVNSAVNGFDMARKKKKGEPTRLVIIHNAGFFSCCSIRLLDLMIYFNENKGLPDEVDDSQQFMHYKANASDNLIPFYFASNDEMPIPFEGRRELTTAKEEPQFSDYKQIVHEDVKPFMEKYFTPSDYALGAVNHLEGKYGLDYENLCAVFYRGNDKVRETPIASYEEFINKAKEIKAANPEMRFLVLPDETEFLEAFLKEFPDSIYFDETPHMKRQDSVMFEQIPKEQRSDYGLRFYAAVLCASKCKHLVLHSGNGANWATLYRGHSENIHQFLTDRWL